MSELSLIPPLSFFVTIEYSDPPECRHSGLSSSPEPVKIDLFKNQTKRLFYSVCTEIGKLAVSPIQKEKGKSCVQKEKKENSISSNFTVENSQWKKKKTRDHALTLYLLMLRFKQRLALWYRLWNATLAVTALEESYRFWEISAYVILNWFVLSLLI